MNHFVTEKMQFKVLPHGKARKIVLVAVVQPNSGSFLPYHEGSINPVSNLAQIPAEIIEK